MNKQYVTAAMTALVLAASSLTAVAQPRHGGGDWQGQGASQRPSHGAHKGQQAHKPAKPAAPAYRPGMQPNHGHPHGMPPGQAKRMGAGPQHNWVKGSRVPPQYRSSHYVVNDWRGHGLKRPARGQQWVQYGGDYLLVAVATGVIAQLVLGY